ncbi:MAG TPA: hypothetical protein VHX87_05065 [Galbitalea sp.]|nr:hypothetical protein [Galbitalea sp.]
MNHTNKHVTLKLMLAILAGAIVAGASGCASSSQPDISQFSNVRAQLDSSNETITFPLDQYFMTFDEEREVEHANQILIDGCMRKYGLSDPVADADWQETSVPPNRKYGIWSLSSAEKYGYGEPEDPVAERTDKILQAQSQAWANIWTKCGDRTKLLPVMIENILSGPGVKQTKVGTTVGLEASDAASNNPKWAAARADWWKCLRSHGLVPRTGQGEWGPVLPTAETAQIRVAVQDVECKLKTNLVQKLADLESQYQAAYAQPQQAALVQQGKLKDKAVAEAKKIIATRNG